MSDEGTKDTPQRTQAEIDATVAKLEAETLKLKAEAEAAKMLAEAQSEQHRADAELAHIKHEIDTYALVRHQTDAAREGERFARERAQDKYHHRYNFAGTVDTTSVDECIAQLNFWDRTEQPGKLEIVFFSPGGSVLSGMALFDHIVEMRSRGWHITTIIRGYAASMGGVLIQAGDVRIMGAESYLLLHEISSLAFGKLGELEDEVAFCKKINERVIELFAKRSKMSAQTIRRRMSRHDWWIDSTEALKLGLVDEIG